MQNVMDAAPDGILVEVDETVVYANDAYVTLLGYRRAAELVQRPVAELVHAEDADRLRRFGRMRATGQRAPLVYDFVARRKDGSPVRLEASVSVTVFHGKSYITTIARPAVMRKANLSDDEVVTGPHENLSKREREVMDRILAGGRPKAIACELGLSEKTVATHRSRLLAKIGVGDSRELYQYALRHRLVDWS